MTLPVFLLICLAANLWAFIAFCLDKVRAVRGEHRTPEASLLGLTLIGGIRAMSACTLVRHKTRKQPFRRYAEWLSGLHIILVAFIATLLY